MVNKKKRRICRILNFAVLNERVKRGKYQDLAREVKQIWKMKVTVIPIVIEEPGTVNEDWYSDNRAWK